MGYPVVRGPSLWHGLALPTPGRGPLFPLTLVLLVPLHGRGLPFATGGLPRVAAEAPPLKYREVNDECI